MKPIHPPKRGSSRVLRPGISLHLDSAHGPPNGGRTARYVVTSHTTAEVSRRYATGVGGAAGSSFLTVTSAPPPALHTLIVKGQRQPTSRAV